MLEVNAFWAVLWLPGLWLVLNWAPAGPQRGPLTLVAKGYLASFAILTPVSVAGYALGLPLSVLSFAVVGSVLVSAIGLGARALRQGATVRWPGIVASLGLAVVIADLYASSCTGGHLGGDAGYHIARVRMLLNSDFTNGDPIVDAAKFDGIYHTNLYHALLASCAQLTGTDPVAVWVHSLPFAKLFVASTSAELAWVLTNRRWAGWIGAITTAVWLGPNTMVVYPNMLALYGVTVLGMAIAVSALSRPDGAKNAFELAALSLVAAQVHGLYYVFIVLLAGPPLLFKAMRAGLRGPQTRTAWLAVGALLVGLAWPATTAQGRFKALLRPAPAATKASAEVKAKAAPKPPALPRGLKRVGPRAFMTDPSGFLQPKSSRFQLLLALALCVGLGPRERRWATLSVFGALGVWLFVPPLCTLLGVVFGAPWMVMRLVSVLPVAFFALFPGALALLVPERFAFPALQVAALAAAAFVANERGFDQKPWGRETYQRRAIDGFKERGDALAVKRARGPAEKARFLSEHVPSRATVWTPLDLDYQTPMVCDCQVLAIKPVHGTRGQGSAMKARRSAHAELVSPKTSPARRVELLERYGIRHFVFEGNQLKDRILRSYGAMVTQVHRLGPLFVVEVDPGRGSSATLRRHGSDRHGCLQPVRPRPACAQGGSQSSSVRSRRDGLRV